LVFQEKLPHLAIALGDSLCRTHSCGSLHYGEDSRLYWRNQHVSLVLLEILFVEQTIGRDCSLPFRALPYFSFEKMMKHRFLPLRNGKLLLLSASRRERHICEEEKKRKDKQETMPEKAEKRKK
jgi:hypothetical protein